MVDPLEDGSEHVSLGQRKRSLTTEGARLPFKAYMEVRDKELEGEFKVSDGGGGTGLLKYKPPPE